MSNSTRWDVEGCGPDQVIEAATPEDAAQIAADDQCERTVTLTWTGTGPDRAVAEYQIDGVPGISGRVVVRRAS